MAGVCSGVIGDFSCPNQIGNRLHVILNAKLCADIYNVSLFWSPNLENGPFICDHYLALHTSSMKEVRKDCVIQEWPYPFTRWKTFKYNHVPLQRQKLSSNGWWDSHSPSPGKVLFCGRMERPLMGLRMSASEPYKTRIDTLFANGLLHAYGRAFHQLFQFVRPTHRPCDLGIHLRFWVRHYHNIIARVLHKASAFDRGACSAYISSNHPKQAIRMANTTINKCKIYTNPAMHLKKITHHHIQNMASLHLKLWMTLNAYGSAMSL